uniref:Putative secreted protein n=1 Tax=Ixodes ricinus TaxID=34613 RepID=A0A6B0U160_IXORI
MARVYFCLPNFSLALHLMASTLGGRGLLLIGPHLAQEDMPLEASVGGTTPLGFIPLDTIPLDIPFL